MKKNSVQFAWRDPRAAQGFRTGISLHGHTHHSAENLRFLTSYRKDFVVIPALLRVASWQHRRFTGDRFDVRSVTWHPPLTPHAALRLEVEQIRSLGLAPLVSLTDHDDIEAGLACALPVSMEWTVPVPPTFFHLGVQNLPRICARGIARELLRASASGMDRVRDALAALAAIPETLVVLNHPMWDEGEIGAPAHLEALRSLLAHCGDYIHAIELNGLRSWSENCAARELAAEWNKPVVSGGDRHGAEPGANLNLSNAASFSEFAAEIRDGSSRILFLPQYREPIRLRFLLAARDLFRRYSPAESSAPSWGERFIYQLPSGRRVPLGELWPTMDPLGLRPFFAALDLAASERLRPALRRMLTGRLEPSFA